MPTKALKPVPEGMNTITTELYYNGNCLQAIEFYKKAFGATTIGEIAKGPDGKSVMHAMLKIGDSNIMLADAWPGNWETGPKNTATAGLFLYVEDCDKLYNQAVKAGCIVVNEMMDAFWGDRMGKVKDPFGHCWSIASLKWILTPEEISKGMDEWMKSVASS
jgi:PhnB protein